MKRLDVFRRAGVLLLVLLAFTCTACSGGGDSDQLLLHLSFDEGSGNQVSDGAGKAQPAEVNYLFTNAAYMESRDPEWRTEGIQDGTISGKNPNKTKEAKKPFVSGPLEVRDGKLTMEVYIDRSLVEGFFNDSKSISMRSYAAFDSQGISLKADGEITVIELYAAEMWSIY